jgi:hypothetical protein
MLKRKVQSLIGKRNLNDIADFEVICDPTAEMIIGGVGCGELLSCGPFNGECPRLMTCVSYTDPSCGTFQ